MLQLKRSLLVFLWIIFYLRIDLSAGYYGGISNHILPRNQTPALLKMGIKLWVRN